MLQYKCDPCGYSTHLKYNYNNHLRTTKHQTKQEETTKGQIETELEELRKTNRDQASLLVEQAISIKHLQERTTDFKSIIEKAVTRPSIVNHNNSRVNKTTNNILNVISPHPLDLVKFQEAVARQFSTNLVLRGNDAMANVILEQLKDDEGRYKITCTDLARQNFQYRDVNGNIKSDPKLAILMDGLRERTKDYYDTNVHMKLYDAAHVKIGKDGNSELDDVYLFQLRDTALFKSSKVIKCIAQKTYIKKAKAKIVFTD